MMNKKNMIIRLLAVGILFMCLCIQTVPAQAFLPPTQIMVKICMYQATYDDNGNSIGKQSVAEESLLLQDGSKAAFANVPELGGYFTLEGVDMNHGLPKFTVQYILEDAVVDCRHFRCEKKISAQSFSCVTGAARQEWYLGKNLWACVVVNIRELPRMQGLILW